jgi:hypothetical protein
MLDSRTSNALSGQGRLLASDFTEALACSLTSPCQTLSLRVLVRYKVKFEEESHGFVLLWGWGRLAQFPDEVEEH